MTDPLLPRPADPSTRRIEDASELQLGQWYWVKFRRRRTVPVDPEAEESGHEYDIDYDAPREEDAEDAGSTDSEEQSGAADEPESEDDGEADESADEVPRWRTIEEEYEALCCIVDIGSNHVKIEYPSREKYRNSAERIHFDRFHERCRLEPDPARAIREAREEWMGETRRLLGEIQQLCLRLSVAQTRKLDMQTEPAEQGTYALATLNRQANVEEYRAELIRAKEQELPSLYKQLESAHAECARWMQAELLPMYAQQKELKEVVGEVEGRIFNVRLYAGLIEDLVSITDGAPAPIGAKLHVMQRRHYMDEECLLAYEAGGLSFDGIHEFDAWLAKPANRDRLLPFPRTVLAFRVRRRIKYRGEGLHPFIRMRLEEEDKLTFLYIRNGERLSRLSTDLDFGLKLFPDTSVFTSGQPLWARVKHNNRIEDFITQGDYEERQKAIERQRAQEAEKAERAAQWAKAHPDADEFDNPHRQSWSRASDAQRDLDEFEPFDPSSVWFDDMHAAIAEEIKQYNRIALLLQGLFDRSEVLHPHPPVRLWEPEGFEAALQLVRDSDRALYAGPPPDFPAYMQQLGEQLGEGCVTIGQESYWGRQEAARENARRAALPHRYRDRDCELSYYEPWGNPGPGRLARIVKWQRRARKARFEWTRERQRETWGHRRRAPIPCSVLVPADELFNVSAYTPGDFRRFFEDPRTRAEYLEWAPLLLAAEEYHAGNQRVGPRGREEPAAAASAPAADAAYDDAQPDPEDSDE